MRVRTTLALALVSLALTGCGSSRTADSPAEAASIANPYCSMTPVAYRAPR